MDNKQQALQVSPKILVDQLESEIKAWEKKFWLFKVLSPKKIDPEYINNTLCDIFSDGLFNKITNEKDYNLTAESLNQFIRMRSYIGPDYKIRIIESFLNLPTLHEDLKPELNEMLKLSKAKSEYIKLIGGLFQ